MNVDPLAKRNASYSSSQDVSKYISQLGISKVQQKNRPLAYQGDTTRIEI